MTLIVLNFFFFFGSFVLILSFFFICVGFARKAGVEAFFVVFKNYFPIYFSAWEFLMKEKKVTSSRTYFVNLIVLFLIFYFNNSLAILPESWFKKLFLSRFQKMTDKRSKLRKLFSFFSPLFWLAKFVKHSRRDFKLFFVSDSSYIYTYDGKY